MDREKHLIVIDKIYKNQEGIELIQVSIHWSDQQVPNTSINIFKYSGYKHSEYFNSNWYQANRLLLHSLDVPAQRDIYPNKTNFWRFLNGEQGKEYYKIKRKILNTINFQEQVTTLLD